MVDAEIQSLYFGLGLSPFLSRPEKYTRITEWLPAFPRRALGQREDSGSFVTQRGRTITFTTKEFGRGDRILLELQAA
jgi:hypothetical protein